MAKLTAWLVTLLGVLLVLDALAVMDITSSLMKWLIAVIVLVIGVGKLMRNYKGK